MAAGAEERDDALDRQVERAVTAAVGRPLGLVLAVIGMGLSVACLGRGALAAAAAWALLGVFGLAVRRGGRGADAGQQG